MSINWHEILETCEKLSYYDRFSDLYNNVREATVTQVAESPTIGSRPKATLLVDYAIEVARKKHPGFTA